MGTVVIYAIIAMTIAGCVLALILYLVAQKFKIIEDPRIDEVAEKLPGANCGGCGFAGCRALAEKIVKEENLDGKFCIVGGNDVMKKVADVMGLKAEENEPKIAVVRCNGGCENTHQKVSYDGVMDCVSANQNFAGESGCMYGCLGLGTCVSVCQFGAIEIDEKTHLPKVNQDKCVGCGACAKICPRHIIELRNKGPKDKRVFVSCVNKEKGAVAKKNCEKACIGCGKCEKTCPFGAITVKDNVSYIDYTKCKMCRKCVEVCPTGAIHAVNFPEKKIVIDKPLETNQEENKENLLKQE